MTSALAWIPFLEPINAFQTWWYLLLVPLAFGISVIYKALRLADLFPFWREVTIMTVESHMAILTTWATFRTIYP